MTAPSLPGDAERAVAFAAESDEPLVIVTFGSFLGRGSADAWETVARGLLDLPVSVMLMGPKDEQVNELHPANDRITSVGYVPLSLVAASASCVVHHGGLGTSIGSLAYGVPAVILPFGFDQPTNAALVARAGAGRVSRSPDTVATDVRALLADDTALSSRLRVWWPAKDDLQPRRISPRPSGRLYHDGGPHSETAVYQPGRRLAVNGHVDVVACGHRRFSLVAIESLLATATMQWRVHEESGLAPQSTGCTLGAADGLPPARGRSGAALRFSSTQLIGG